MSRPKPQPITRKRLPFKHDHRQSLWLIAGGHICWCYRCGAWQHNWAGAKWNYPTGPNGINPAMLEKIK